MVNKKTKHSPKAKQNNFITGWQARYPVLIFVGLFALIMAGFYVMFLSQWFTRDVQGNVNTFNAWVSNKVLVLLAQHTTASGETIYSSSYSISVARGCDGIEAMAIFVSAVLAFPLTWLNKIKGVFFGVLILFLMNIIRVISLFLIGVHYPKLFDVMHMDVWQALFIIIAVGLWIGWILKASKPKIIPNA